jgi:hypothetical protein
MFFSQPNLLIQRFGWSVAMLDDDLIAVGAIYYLQNTGAVHVFQSNTLMTNANNTLYSFYFTKTQTKTKDTV